MGEDIPGVAKEWFAQDQSRCSVGLTQVVA
jgi:hypothetical protein